MENGTWKTNVSLSLSCVFWSVPGVKKDFHLGEADFWMHLVRTNCDKFHTQLCKRGSGGSDMTQTFRQDVCIVWAYSFSAVVSNGIANEDTEIEKENRCNTRAIRLAKTEVWDQRSNKCGCNKEANSSMFMYVLFLSPQRSAQNKRSAHTPTQHSNDWKLSKEPQAFEYCHSVYRMRLHVRRQATTSIWPPKPMAWYLIDSSKSDSSKQSNF